ncbi:MAG: hypothetical protein HYS21_12545 [Deltaproteobacteria bacterium]|nr:hypothetical protein [Deltaproteobacteria bacterium]
MANKMSPKELTIFEEELLEEDIRMKEAQKGAATGLIEGTYFLLDDSHVFLINSKKYKTLQ